MQIIRRLFLISCILLLFSISVSQAQVEPANHDILVLLGLDEMGLWENDFTQTYFDTLKTETDISISIHYQFLGLNRYTNDTEPSDLLNYLERIALNTPYDLVMAILPGANQFLVDYGDRLYPDIPKLYILPSNTSLEQIQSRMTTLSAVVQSGSTTAIENTVTTMVTILPNTRHIYVVGGSGTGDIAYNQRAEAIFEASPLDGIDVTYLIGLNQANLIEVTSQLPPDSAILLLTYDQDKQLNSYTSVEILEQLNMSANAPIFTFFDTLVGRGVVGGNVTSSSLYAESAAELTSDILQGSVIENNITHTGNTAYIYDWRQLQRWQIDESLLPANSLVEFKTLTVWEQYRTIIISVLIVIVAQFISILALIWTAIQRRSALQSVHKSETEFRTMFENSIDAVVTSLNGMIVMCNPAYVHLHGYKHIDELIGKPLLDQIAPHEKARIAEYGSKRNERQDVVTSYETCGIRQNGQEFDMEVHVSTYTLNDAFYILAIIRDISERKKLEQLARNAKVLEVQLEKEKEIVVLKERFVGIISHDFRTPLTVINTSVHLLNAYGNSITEERRVNNLQKISAEVQNLNEMIENLLPLVRNEGQSIVLNTKDTDIKQFCESILEQICIIDQAKHNFVLVDNAAIASIPVDHGLMRQILANLLTNAMKFSPEDSTISIELESTEQSFIINIEDEGIGIPDEDIDQLFKPFQRASNASDIKGVGLGLSIVKEYVELHDGRLDVRSEIDKGTVFSITLPLS